MTGTINHGCVQYDPGWVCSSCFYMFLRHLSSGWRGKTMVSFTKLSRNGMLLEFSWNSQQEFWALTPMKPSQKVDRKHCTSPCFNKAVIEFGTSAMYIYTVYWICIPLLDQSYIYIYMHNSYVVLYNYVHELSAYICLLFFMNFPAISLLKVQL